MLKPVREVFRKIVIFLFLLLTVSPVLLETVGNLSHKSYLLALCAACILFEILLAVGKKEGLRSFQSRMNNGSPVLICAAMSMACLLINGAFAFIFRPVQAADYRTFFQVAKDLSCGVHPGMRDYVAMFPHILGYASFLSIFLKLFGQSLTVAVWVNVVLTTMSGVFLFCMVYRMTDLYSAAAVYLLWIICPSKLYYNTMSLSEPYYTCLLLLFFLIVCSTADRMGEQKKSTWVRCVICAGICGGVLTLLQAARPIAAVPMIALSLWLLFLSDIDTFRKDWKRWMVFLLVLFLSYHAGGSIWRRYAAEQLEQMPPSVPGYNIYVGFNLDTNGSYSDEDMNLFQKRYFGEYEKNAVAAQERMLEDAKERIETAKPVWFRLMLQKLKILLGHDEGGVYYAMDSLTGRQYAIGCLISNVWYYLIWLLAICGCIRIWIIKESGLILVPILFVIGLILAQLLVEVAARYHYSLIPVLLMVSGYALQTEASRRNLSVRKGV